MDSSWRIGGGGAYNDLPGAGGWGQGWLREVLCGSRSLSFVGTDFASSSQSVSCKCAGPWQLAVTCPGDVCVDWQPERHGKEAPMIMRIPRPP